MYVTFGDEELDSIQIEYVGSTVLSPHEIKTAESSSAAYVFVYAIVTEDWRYDGQISSKDHNLEREALALLFDDLMDIRDDPAKIIDKYPSHVMDWAAMHYDEIEEHAYRNGTHLRSKVLVGEENPPF